MFTTLAIAVTALVWRYGAPAVRMPYFIYLGFYVLTTGIGGVALALTNGDLLETFEWGLDVSVLGDLNNLRYWALLYGPLLIPGIVIVLFQDFRVVEYGIETTLASYRDGLNCSTLLLVYLAFMAYCIAKLAMHGYLLGITMWFTLQGDFLSMMVFRDTLVTTLGTLFFGLTYITLPMLSLCALYQFGKTRKMAWAALFLFMFGGNVFLSMTLVQKSPVIIFMVFQGIACVEMKLIRWQGMIAMFCGIVGMLNLMQSFYLQDWDYARSLNLMIFRMAHCYPYYMAVYPDVLPFGGIDLGLHLIGIGEASRDNFDVFKYMYPQITWVEGATPGPAHVRAYSQGGEWFALFTLALIGFALKAVGSLRGRINGPVSFAFYIQSLVFVYYLTQTSFREAILSCYGLFWAFIGIIPLVLFNQPPREVPNPARTNRDLTPPVLSSPRRGRPVNALR
ncbi:MAG: hypothetical protein U0903_09940 [Planctomycetales bacterium]